MRTLVLVLIAAFSLNAAEPEHEPGDGGPASAAFLNFPEGVAVDPRGNIFVTERAGNRVRRIDGKTGIITTVASNLNAPTGIVVTRGGDVLFGDTFHHRIQRIDGKTGAVTTIAGTGEAGFSGDGGAATAAKITNPFGLALDRDENLYFTDTEVHRIRRIDRNGIITTVAGNGVWAFAGDGGPATAASLARPHRITFDPAGNLIIADSFNQRLRRVDARTGVITTFAGRGLRGSSGDGGPAMEATFCYFGDVLFDRRGDLLVSGVCDSRIRRIDMRTGTVHPFASGFDTPAGMALDARGHVLVADMRNHRVERIDPRTAAVATVAGGPAPRNPAITWRFVWDRAAFEREVGGAVPLRIEGMERVRVQRDAGYDLYLPERESGAPLVVLMSGRNDTEVPPGEWGIFQSRARLFAAGGFPTVMFNHRLGLNGTIPQAAEDLEALLRRLEPKRVVLVAWGMGAAAAAETLRGARLTAAVLIHPYADLRPLAEWQAPGRTAANAERYSLAPSKVPLLVARAGKDSAPILAGIDAFVSASLAANAPLQAINDPQAEPGKESEAVLRAVLAFLSSADLTPPASPAT